MSQSKKENSENEVKRLKQQVLLLKEGKIYILIEKNSSKLNQRKMQLTSLRKYQSYISLCNIQYHLYKFISNNNQWSSID